MILTPLVKRLDYTDAIISYVIPKDVKQLSIIVDTPDAILEYGFDAALDRPIKVQSNTSHTPIDLRVEDRIATGVTMYFRSDVNPTVFNLLLMKHAGT